MAISVLRGAPGAGKNAWLENNHPDDLILDTTLIWAAILNLGREGGRYRERLHDEQALRLAQYLKFTGLRWAAREDVDAWFTVANSSPAPVERVREVVTEEGGRFGVVHTITVSEAVARARLTDPATGILSDECQQALGRWF